MGGGMAYYLACHAANVFAAVAPAAFDLFQDNVDDCQPSRPITVISFRGTADQTVPYAGGLVLVIPTMPVTFLGAQATFQRWADLDQCTDPAPAEDANGCSTRCACQGGVEAALCTKQGGGQEMGNAGVAWPMLKRHTL
jgi:polyhydroxybutyrate depolymerase